MEIPRNTFHKVCDETMQTSYLKETRLPRNEVPMPEGLALKLAIKQGEFSEYHLVDPKSATRMYNGGRLYTEIGKLIIPSPTTEHYDPEDIRSAIRSFASRYKSPHRQYPPEEEGGGGDGVLIPHPHCPSPTGVGGR